MASKSPTPDLSAVDALTRVTGALGATEARPGQVAMVQAVERVIRAGGRLTVAAPTGSGKSFGLLVPAIVAGVADGRRVVVVTATKALQDQYVADLAHLDRTIGDTVPFAWAVQKGRGNYLCSAALDRVRDALNPAQGQLDVQSAGDDDELDGVDRDELDQVLGWAEITVSGDLAELPAPPSARTAAAVTCSPGGCPGSKCEKALGCPAMAAADKANEADVVIVNAALFAQSLRDRGYDIGDAPVSIRSYAMRPSRGHPQRSPWFCGSRGHSARQLVNAAGSHAVSSGRPARAQETRERWAARRGVLQRRVAPTHQLAPTGARTSGATVDRRCGCRRLPLFRRCGGWDEQKAGVVTGPMVGARGRGSAVLASLRAER